MSKLYYAFSNIKTLLMNKGNGNINLKSPDNLSVNNETFERKNIIFGKMLSELKTLKERGGFVRKVSQSSLEYSYFKAEYSHGSFCETVSGELLIPNETVSYVKEKVR